MKNSELADLLERLASYAEYYNSDKDTDQSAEDAALAAQEAHRLREWNREEGQRATKAALGIADAFDGIGAGRRSRRVNNEVDDGLRESQPDEGRPVKPHRSGGGLHVAPSEPPIKPLGPEFE